MEYIGWGVLVIGCLIALGMITGRVKFGAEVRWKDD